MEEQFKEFLKKQRATAKSRRIFEAAGLKVPEELRRRVVKKVTSKIGTLSLTTDGMAQSAAVETVRKFEENAGGKAKVIEALEMLESEGKLGEREQLFLNHAREPNNSFKTLARLITECEINPLKVMNLYTKGCIELGKMEAAIEAHKGLPQVVKNLNSHALSEAGDVCILCAGTGQVSRRAGTKSPKAAQIKCPKCEGLGRQLTPSDLKKFAMEKLLEVTKMVGEKQGVTVQTNIGVQIPLGGSVLEKVMGAADEVLYRRKVEDVVEAEVIKEEGNG